MSPLENKKVAIITEDGFEEVELTSPKEALEKAGATVHIISSHDKVKAWDHDHWSIELPVDEIIGNVNADDYDALMIPGGVLNPDKMREDQRFVDFAKAFLKAKKPIGAICHGPQLLIETQMLTGRQMTSYHSVKTDLQNAGVNWKDKVVVVDKGLVTSRCPRDLVVFNEKLIEEIEEGVHSNRYKTLTVPVN
jgi:protease I